MCHQGLGEKLSDVVQTVDMTSGPLLFLIDILSVLSDPKNLKKGIGCIGGGHKQCE